MATMNPRAKAALMAAMARQRQGATPAAMPAMAGASGMPPMVGGMGGGAPAPAPTSMKKGGSTKKMAKGGSASARADGIASRGLTKGTIC